MEHYLLGLGLVIIYILLVRKISTRLENEYLSYALGLVVAAFIYIGFALWTKAVDWYLIEFGGVIIYGVFAYLGVKHSYWWLALGWFLHVFWDINLHMHNHVDFVPHWYPPACLTFDIALAAYIIWRSIRQQKSIA